MRKLSGICVCSVYALLALSTLGTESFHILTNLFLAVIYDILYHYHDCVSAKLSIVFLIIGEIPEI